MQTPCLRWGQVDPDREPRRLCAKCAVACSKCGNATDRFHAGRPYQCSACQSARQAARYASDTEHREKCLERSRAQRERLGPTAIREYQSELYRRRRRAWVEYLGGECKACGPPDALEFDHIDYGTK